MAKDARDGREPDPTALINGAAEGRMEQVAYMLDFARKSAQSGGAGFGDADIAAATTFAYAYGQDGMVALLQQAEGTTRAVVDIRKAPVSAMGFLNKVLDDTCSPGYQHTFAVPVSAAIKRMFEAGTDLDKEQLTALFSKGRGTVPNKALVLRMSPSCQPPGPPREVVSATLCSGIAEHVALLLQHGVDFSIASKYSLTKATPEMKAMLKAHARAQALSKDPSSDASSKSARRYAAGML